MCVGVGVGVWGGVCGWVCVFVCLFFCYVFCFFNSKFWLYFNVYKFHSTSLLEFLVR